MREEMNGKWSLIAEGYILKPEFCPPDVVAVVQETEPGRYDGIVTSLKTNKRIVSARPLALSTMKRKTEQVANTTFRIEKIRQSDSIPSDDIIPPQQAEAQPTIPQYKVGDRVQVKSRGFRDIIGKVVDDLGDSEYAVKLDVDGAQPSTFRFLASELMLIASEAPPPTAAPEINVNPRNLQLLTREDGSFSVYYPLGGAHMVIYDSLDDKHRQARIDQMATEIEALRAELDAARTDVVMLTAENRKLRNAGRLLLRG